MSGGEIGSCESPTYKLAQVIEGIKHEISTGSLKEVDHLTAKRLGHFLNELEYAKDTIHAIEYFVHGDASIDPLKSKLRHYRE